MDQHVLIVEDNADAREIMSMTLEAIQVSVKTVENGQQALDQITNERPALILLDLKMPVMDGYDFMEILHKDPELAEIPIVIVSAYGVTDDMVDVRKRPGVIAVLHKGAYHIDDMRRIVIAALGLPMMPA